ncbi:PAP 25A associated domain family [Colletotrichum higginsianum]|nr:PAP 25A associated domain family [Colletotrichum higginsianum]
MPYSIGSDKLERTSPDKIKSKLSEDEERKLTTDMRELYDRLTPTEKVEENRQKLVVKLEKIFNEEWPGNDIRVHLFGSSGNLLCSDDSDEGMKKVVCISAAKVPIVKIWDPELGLACDMNVNNTLALENTRMVRTYVEIDPRVRPLAMIVKYWTRQRIVNDAAFGGTLSSYTWICLIIGFLQLRDPPVLPSLHQRQHQRLPKRGGQESAFADDLDKLRGFGDKNKASLGELLFQFFRFYAHEFDYDKNAISIRLGRKVTKQEKGWHIGINNHLCVEEPFNTIRNLGNTADEYSFRGLHLELRRAFNLISEGKLDECCENDRLHKHGLS